MGMMVTYIRSSSYGKWDFCQMQYFIGYVLGYQEDSNKAAEKGTVVHKVMERMGEEAQQGNIWTDEEVLASVDRWWEHYTSKSVNKKKFTTTDYNECVKWTFMALEYNDGQFDPRKRDILAVEKKFDLVIDEPWAFYEYDLPNGEKLEGQFAIKGTIDLVTQDNGHLEAIDWKTGARKNWATGEEYTYSKLMDSPQLLLYNYALSRLYPDRPDAMMTIFYIKDGGPFTMCFGEMDRERFMEMLKNRVQEIQNCSRPKMLSNNQNHFKCTRMCHFYKNKFRKDSCDNMCMETKKMINKEGMDATIAKLQVPDFDVGYYHDPGK